MHDLLKNTSIPRSPAHIFPPSRFNDCATLDAGGAFTECAVVYSINSHLYDDGVCRWCVARVRVVMETHTPTR